MFFFFFASKALLPIVVNLLITFIHDTDTLTKANKMMGLQLKN